MNKQTSMQVSWNDTERERQCIRRRTSANVTSATIRTVLALKPGLHCERQATNRPIGGTAP